MDDQELNEQERFAWARRKVQEAEALYQKRVEEGHAFYARFYDAILVLFYDLPNRGLLINANDPTKIKTVWREEGQEEWKLIDAALEIGCQEYVAKAIEIKKAIDSRLPADSISP